MFDLTGVFNPLIIDIAILVIVTFAVLVGFIKGSSRVLLDLVLRIVSFALAFSVGFGFMKRIFLRNLNLNKYITSPNELLNYSIGLIQVFLASLAVYFVLYGLLKLMVTLFRKALRREKRNNITSRIVGGVVNGAFRALVLFLIVYAASARVIGLTETIDKTPISSKVVSVMNKIMDDEKVNKVVSNEKVFIALIDGNLFIKTDEEDLARYKAAYEEILVIMEDSNAYYAPLTGSNIDARLELIEKMVDNMIVLTDLAIMVKDDYEDIVIQTDNLINQLINEVPVGVSSNILPEEKKNMLAENMIELDGNSGVRSRVFDIINYSE
ncbi:TPA: CvpA family protein [bacterium]|nr:CvpA family protein [bacterium]